MGQIIRLLRSSVSGQKPTTSKLTLGELAINTTDGKIFFAKTNETGITIEEIVTTNTVNTGSLNILGNITTEGYLQLLPSNNQLDTTVSGSYLFVSGSDNDLYFNQNKDGINNYVKLNWLEGNLYTGLLHGGLLSATPGSTTFNISHGEGLIVDLNTTINNEPNPIIKNIKWNTQTGITLTYLNTAIQSFIGIDENGNIVQQTTAFNDGQYNTIITIGTVLHQNQSTVNATITYPNVAYGYKQRTYDFIKAFGPLKLSGFQILPVNTLGLNIGSGTAWADGRNYQNDPNNPSYITDTGTTVSKIFRYHQVSGTTFVQDTNSASGYTEIDVTKYNNNGVLTAVPGTGSNKKWTIQRVFWYPNSATKGIVVYYGNNYYDSATDAAANIQYETFFEVENTKQNAIYLGAIAVRNDATWADTTSFSILPGGIFRSVGGSGGGGSVPTNNFGDLLDVQFGTLNNGDLPIYNSTLSKWINSKTLTGNYLIDGTITGTTFVKSGGTSSQYLMADGSVSTLNVSGLTLSGGTLTLSSGYSIPTTTSQTNWDTAYTDRFKWDGSSSGLVASTARTSLGATTVGGNLFTLTNPSAITFLQINANNTVSTLDAASFRTAIGAGTSSTTGTVTSVGITVPTGLSVSGTPITTSGTFAITFSSGYSIPTTTSQTNWDTAYTDTNSATSSNTVSTIVKRDASGNFVAGTITGTTFVKSGGTSSQYLMADGSVSTLSSFVSSTGTTNYIPKWTSSTVIGNSIIYDNGTNVGIGTTSVIEKLTVNGNILSSNINGRIQSGGNTTGIVANLGTTQTSNGSALSYKSYFSYDTYWDNSLGLWIGNRTDLGRKWVVETGYHTDSFKIRYYNGGTYTGWTDSSFSDLFTVKGSGNVGINSSLTVGKLNIENTGSILAYLKSSYQSGDYNYSDILIGNDVSANKSFTIGVAYNTGTTSESYVHMTSYGQSYGSQFILKANGNVGIGTSSPSAKLHVSGTSLFTGNMTTNGSLLLESSSFIDLTINQTDSSMISFGVTSASNEGYINVSNTEPSHITGVTDLKLLFNASEKFRFNSDGNFGIGTSSPSAKLHLVNGGQTILLGTGTNSSSYTLSVGVNDDGINFTNNSTVRGFNFINSNGTLGSFDSNGNLTITNSIATGTTFLLTLKTTATGGKANLQFVSGSTRVAYIGFGSPSNTNLYINNDTSGMIKFQTSATERMSIDSSGNVLMGSGSPNTAMSLSITSNIIGGSTAYGIVQQGAVQTGVTSQAYGIYNQSTTIASSFTLTNYYHFAAIQGTIGAGSVITSQTGFFVGSNMVGATNNYGFVGNIPSGTGDWNLYMGGTASNYLAGKLLIGSTTDSGENLQVTGTAKITSNLTVSGNITSTGDLTIDGVIKNRAGGDYVGINASYGMGDADEVLFDWTNYSDKAWTTNNGINGETWTVTSGEWVYETTHLFSGGRVLETSSARNFYSDYIPVTPGDTLFGEMYVKYISGTGGTLYFGVEQYDSQKRAIATNQGTSYFVAAGTTENNTSWVQKSGYITLPTSHTPFTGTTSDGGGVYYVRLRILMNYQTGGALRQFGGIKLKKINKANNLIGTTIELNGGQTYDPSGGGTGTETATDVALSIKTGTRIVGYHDGYIRTLLGWTQSSNIVIGQAGTSLIGGVSILPGSQGKVAIGSAPDTYSSFRILSPISDSAGGNSAYGFLQSGTLQSGITGSSVGIYNIFATVAASFTSANYYHFLTSQGTIGAGSTVTNQHGFFANANLTGATNNYGFRGDIASGTNRWNLYMGGTASNYLAGKLLIGSTTDTGQNLQITGTAIISSDLTVSGTITGTLSGNASTATTLATTRTLWGQNFNGSANVTGNLTSVGNITASGAMTISTTTTSALTLDSGTTGAVNIGTNANAKTITIGNTTGATGIVVNSGTAGVIFNQVASGVFKIQASSARTTDMVQITNSGQAITTAGVNALSITYVGGAAAVESSAMRIDLTPGGTSGGIWSGLRMTQGATTASGVIVNVLKVDTITAGIGTDNVLWVGTGYDNILNYNGTTVINGTGQLIAGQLTGTIPSAVLGNSSLFIGTTSVALNRASGALTLAGVSLSTLTLAVSGTGLSGSATYNGSGATTFTVTSNATSANTASTIVARDASGNFIAGTITGTTFVKSGGTSSQYLMADGSVSTLSSIVTSTGTLNYIPKWTSTTVIGDSLIYDNGTNIGIGTTSPSAKLHLVNGLQTILLGSGTNTSGYSLSIGVNDDGINFTNNSNGRGFNFINSNGTLGSFDSNGNLTITNSITTGSTFLLTLKTTATGGKANLQFLSGSTRVAYIGFGSTSNTNLYISNDTSTGDIKFQTNANEKMTISSVGNVLIGGGTPNIANSLSVAKNIEGSSQSIGIIQAGTVQTGVLIAYGVYNTFSTVASTGATGITYYHYSALQGTIGVGSTVTNQYGFFVSSNLTSASNNYAFYGNIPSGTGDWNLYMGGTASNYLAGKLLIGSTTDSGQNFQVTGTAIISSDLTVSGTYNSNTNSTRDKIRVWNNNNYTIGMQSGITFGSIQSEYAMTFQMNDQATRGFWWGDAAHTTAQGAMSLSTDGKLSIAHSIRAGYGESDTTVPGATYRLDISGNTLLSGNLNVNGTQIITTTTAPGLTISGITSFTSSSAIIVNGYNTKGGGTYFDFLSATNTLSTGTTPTKWFRLDNVGSLQIINSAYTTQLLELTDSGNLSTSGSLTTKGVTFNYRLVTATTSILDSDYFVEYSGSTAVTLTLPSAIGRAGKIFFIKRTGTGVVTIGFTASQKLDSFSTWSLDTQYVTLMTISNGTQWLRMTGI